MRFAFFLNTQIYLYIPIAKSITCLLNLSRISVLHIHFRSSIIPEVFKNMYSNAIGEENTFLYRTSLYLAASASAEFFADIALSPMESVKVRMQTSPVGTFPKTLREAAPKIYAAEGLNGFYKSLVPLWGRQIPYTMMKFACFERTVEALYKYVVPKPRAECSKSEQLVVTFAAGYIAGGKW